MIGHLNHLLAQQLIDERLRDARERRATLPVAEHHDRERTFSVLKHRIAGSLLQPRRRDRATQRSR